MKGLLGMLLLTGRVTMRKGISMHKFVKKSYWNGLLLHYAGCFYLLLHFIGPEQDPHIFNLIKILILI